MTLLFRHVGVHNVPAPRSKESMKRNAEVNKLCLSCRRQCKQAAMVVVSSCPRYYPGPKVKREEWKQMEFDLLSSP